ncbi:response regulator transcription factor [Anaerovorax odorimutans]|uniref:Stage 0 sporulation protein A homolog n=1 Tax=Anaerovorax odorimutans TaxID=109327 RepID=A0ABT1RS11_9FIRM|nr:response regulator transcription factor [Anaerovorax odorimutans]MCQ4637993.1 response regulator transcription factor [Anaerovorax odorimutans]
MYNILICDDEKDIVSALKIYLASDDYNLYEAYDGPEALEVIEKNDIHLILLDIMMPKLDGIQVLTRMRKSYNIPVIFLTAKGEDTDKILGLNLGADDYITKPFNPVELLARVKSQLRRYMELGSGAKKSSVLKVGDIELDDSAKAAFLMGEPVSLTPKEYGILKLLMEHPGQVFSPKQIYGQVWEEHAYGAEGTVAVHIRHLREKVEANPDEPRHLKVVWGQGYKIE